MSPVTEAAVKKTPCEGPVTGGRLSLPVLAVANVMFCFVCVCVFFFLPFFFPLVSQSERWETGFGGFVPCDPLGVTR